MVNSVIYLEGGGESKELKSRCREAFSKLLEASGFKGRLPRLVACGGRAEAYNDFCTAHRQNVTPFIGLWVDSEDPVANLNATWTHLMTRDQWARPAGATDEQVLLMVTCMETWIVSDRKTLKNYYGKSLIETRLPPLVNLETRARNDIQSGLIQATSNCRNNYLKGSRSFRILAIVDPTVLRQHLPSFSRILTILQQHL